MDTTNSSKLPPKLGVWLRYRSIGSPDVRSIFTSGVLANRMLRKIARQRRTDYLHVEGVYEAVIPRNITILRGTSEADTRKRSRYIPEGHTTRTVRDTFTHMAFHAAKLDNAVLVFCPTTGICGTLDMPALPIALVYTHPLSHVANALSLIRAVGDDRTIRRMERQVYAGTLLSLLRGKHLLRTDKAESDAAEQNLVLQAAGNSVLHTLCATIARLWDNPNVWNKVPSLNVDWRTHATATYSGVNIAQVLQAFTRIIQQTLEPLALSDEDRGRYLTARRERSERGNVPSYIKVHSASAVQARNVRESKSTARTLFDNVANFLPIALRTATSRVIRDLLLLPNDAKDSAATALEAASDAIAPLQAAVVLELASLVRAAKTERIMDEVGSFMQEVSPIRARSMAEILEAKRLKREDKENTRG